MLKDEDRLHVYRVEARRNSVPGEGDRASAVLFFPTIVRQLHQKIPNLAQFDKLLESHYRKYSPTAATYIIVVDALDECQKEDDIQTLLQLWSRVSQYRHRCLRWFLTRWPELVIQLGFSRVSIDARQEVVLHEIPPLMIKHDISIFLADTFSQIRDEYNCMPLPGVFLPEDWPGVTDTSCYATGCATGFSQYTQ